MRPGIMTFCAGLTLLVPASIGLLLRGVPTVTCPFPLLTVIPLLLLARWHLEKFAVLVPTLLFFSWNIRLFRVRGTVPRRSYWLLVTTAILSIVWFALGWQSGIHYHGARYVYVVFAVNVSWLLLLFALFARGVRRLVSFKADLLFHWILFAWLAWYAFPYLGELP